MAIPRVLNGKKERKDRQIDRVGRVETNRIKRRVKIVICDGYKENIL